MRTIIECVPNFSEGRDAAKVEAIIQALEQAGIPRSQWYAVNMTGDAEAEARLAGQLQRNNLPSAGTPTVTPEQ